MFRKRGGVVGAKSFKQSTDEDLLWREMAQCEAAVDPPCLKLAVPHLGCVESKSDDRCEWPERTDDNKRLDEPFLLPAGG